MQPETAPDTSTSDPWPLLHLADLSIRLSDLPSLAAYQLALAPLSTDWPSDDNAAAALMKRVTKLWRQRREKSRARQGGAIGCFAKQSGSERFPLIECIDLGWTLSRETLPGLTSAQLVVSAARLGRAHGCSRWSSRSVQATLFHPNATKDLVGDASDVCFFHTISEDNADRPARRSSSADARRASQRASASRNSCRRSRAHVSSPDPSFRRSRITRVRVRASRATRSHLARPRRSTVRRPSHRRPSKSLRRTHSDPTSRRTAIHPSTDCHLARRSTSVSPTSSRAGRRRSASASRRTRPMLIAGLGRSVPKAQLHGPTRPKRTHGRPARVPLSHCRSSPTCAPQCPRPAQSRPNASISARSHCPSRSRPNSPAGRSCQTRRSRPTSATRSLSSTSPFRAKPRSTTSDGSCSARIRSHPSELRCSPRQRRTTGP